MSSAAVVRRPTDRPISTPNCVLHNQRRSVWHTTNEMSTLVGGVALAVGEAVAAMGAAPGGGRVWFRATVVALRTRYPPIHVKYTATMAGESSRLALPEPVNAYLHADDVRRHAASE